MAYCSTFCLTFILTNRAEEKFPFVCFRVLSTTVNNVPVMTNIIYIFKMKTLLWGTAIFSEKSHQQGHDPSLNPLFSATRSLSTRKQNHAATPPPPHSAENTRSPCC